MMIKYHFFNDFLKEQCLLTTAHLVDYCSVASCYGHLDILVFLHQEKCIWDQNSCIYASENGHLECLKYLHENGCPWNEYSCLCASWKGHLECLIYLQENGMEYVE